MTLSIRISGNKVVLKNGPVEESFLLSDVFRVSRSVGSKFSLNVSATVYKMTVGFMHKQPAIEVVCPILSGQEDKTELETFNSVYKTLHEAWFKHQ